MRLQRFGRIRAPFYRVVTISFMESINFTAALITVSPQVVTDSRKSRQGAYIESVGTYNPIADKNGAKASAAETFFRPESVCRRH